MAQHILLLVAAVVFGAEQLPAQRHAGGVVDRGQAVQGRHGTGHIRPHIIVQLPGSHEHIFPLLFPGFFHRFPIRVSRVGGKFRIEPAVGVGVIGLDIHTPGMLCHHQQLLRDGQAVGLGVAQHATVGRGRIRIGGNAMDPAVTDLVGDHRQRVHINPGQEVLHGAAAHPCAGIGLPGLLIDLTDLLHRLSAHIVQGVSKQEQALPCLGLTAVAAAITRYDHPVAILLPDEKRRHIRRHRRAVDTDM